MRICKLCMTRTKEEGWYVGYDNKIVADELLCEAHPRLDNWRLVRAMKTMISWTMEGTGFKVTLSATCKMPVNLGGGHIHERTARAKLFDYEGPFLDLLVKKGHLKRYKGHRTPEQTLPRSLVVTASGFEFVRKWISMEESKKNTAKLK